MKKPETNIVNNIMLVLSTGGGWWFKVHGGPFQLAGVPDIIGCYQGHFVGIEVKQPGKVATKLQQYVLDRIAENQGRCGVAHTLMEALDIRNGVTTIY